MMALRVVPAHLVLVQEDEWTVTAEWDLVCERAFLAPLITTTYFCGVMVGWWWWDSGSEKI